MQFGEESAAWMLNAAAGIDHTPVEQRALTASIGCGKSYRQKNLLPPAALDDTHSPPLQKALVDQ